VVEHVYRAEMRVVVAKVLTFTANALLVAQHLLKLGAHLTTALARLQVHNLARRSSFEVKSTREKKGMECGNMQKTPGGNLAREGVQKPSSSDCQALIPHSGSSFPRNYRPKS
jgi:hypothetical protein